MDGSTGFSAIFCSLMPSQVKNMLSDWEIESSMLMPLVLYKVWVTHLVLDNCLVDYATFRRLHHLYFVLRKFSSFILKRQCHEILHIFSFLNWTHFLRQYFKNPKLFAKSVQPVTEEFRCVQFLKKKKNVNESCDTAPLLWFYFWKNANGESKNLN